MKNIAPHHLSTLRRMLTDIDPIRGHESERQKNALLAVLKAADNAATVNVVANKSIAEIIAEHDPNSSFDARDMALSVGKVVTGTLLIVAPENSNEDERNKIANDLSEIHDGPVLVFAHGWRTMDEEDLADLRNILNKSDKAMLDLFDTQSPLQATQNE